MPARNFAVTITVDGTPYDATPYINKDSWQSGSLMSERTLMAFEGGDLSFTMVDKDTDSSHAGQFWADLLAQATDLPTILVQDDSVSPAKEMFFGYIEHRNITRDNIHTSFTAISALNYADRLDMHDDLEGQGETNTYSGLASTLAATALRKAGHAAPDAATDEVDIKDYYLGSTQQDTDYNHALRTWHTAGADPDTETMLSDLVPWVHDMGGGVTSLGFQCIHGKLYRVDSAARSGIALTQITTVPEGENEAVSNGTRLFYYTDADLTDCLCIVQTEAREMRTRTQNPTNLFGTLVTTAAMIALAQWNPWVAIGAGLTGTQLLKWLAGSSLRPTGEQNRVVTAIHIMDIDSSGGLGNNVNRTISPRDWYYAADGDYFVPGDSICSTRPWEAVTSLIYCGRYVPGENRTYLHSFEWNGQAWEKHTLTTLRGRPSGGAAAVEGFSLFGMEDGVALSYEVRSGYVITNRSAAKTPPSRFFCALPYDHDGKRKIKFPVGNGQDYCLTAYYHGAALHVDRDTINNLPAGKSVLIHSNPYRITFPVGSAPACTGIYRALGDDDRPYLYCGWFYIYDNVLRRATTYEPCAHALPMGGDGDWRPPMLYSDTNHINGATIYRLVPSAVRLAGDRIVVDHYHTSCWPVARVHHDFKHDRMSIRQVLEGIARSYGCYLKLMTTSKPSSADEVKIMSRFGHTPASVGTISADEVSKGPLIVGTEYYLGAEANVQGERITDGDVSIGTAGRVFPVGGVFMTPNWARGLADWVTTQYPETSADYPNGRRIMEPWVRVINNAGTKEYPGFSDLYKTATVTCYERGGSAETITGLIIGVSFDRATMRYRVRLIEYASADVTWTADEPAATEAEVAFFAETATDEIPTVITASKISVGCMTHPLLLNIAKDNPTTYPCAWTWKVHLPHGLNLTHYRYGLWAEGTELDSAFWMSIWTDSGGNSGYPLAEIDSCRSLLLHDGQAAGPVNTALNWKLADTSAADTSLATISSYYLTPAIYWVVAVQDGTESGTTPAPIDWWDLGQAGCGDARNLPFSADTSGDFSLGTWIDYWDSTLDQRSRFAPAIYLVGEV